jgi:2-oxoglutarate ferredoxin oxidoreductase subunit beta
MLFDNRIYGLTKGQYSPTSEVGKRTKSTPFGSVDRPFDPLRLVLGAGATFVARSVDVFSTHLKDTLLAAHAHSGTAFVQIYQNCNIFNDGAFESFREKDQRDENVLFLEHGKPLVFGKNRDRGIRLAGPFRPEVVQLGNGITEADLVVHDEAGPPGYHAMLCELAPPDFPQAIGVFRKTSVPTFEHAVRAQIDDVIRTKGPGDLARALAGGTTWKVD